MGRWLNAARSISPEREKSQTPPAHEPTKLTKPSSVSSVSSDLGHIEKFQIDEATFDERAGMAAGLVPDRYLEAWAAFQCHPPKIVSADIWRNAVADGGLLLDQWGGILASFNWPAVAIFGPEGFVWEIDGESVSSIGPDHVVMTSGRAIGRAEPSGGR